VNVVSCSKTVQPPRNILRRVAQQLSRKPA
jgi:hypothetical protein